MKHELRSNSRAALQKSTLERSGERLPDDAHRQRRLVSCLQKPAVFSHAIENWQLIETHISWVILCGDFAYKIKKALNLGFLDFTTLEKRKFYCQEELRLNSRLAPDLYLAVVPITGPVDRPRFEGIGRPCEYAVKMRRFGGLQLLSDMAQCDLLAARHIDQLIAQVAAFHSSVPSALPDTRYGSPEYVHASVNENYAQILEQTHDLKPIQWVKRLRAWTNQQYRSCYPIFVRRKQRGLVRECHGDMHLGNIALVDGVPVIFDGVEFNPDLYWIDVMSDVAFLLMDLEVHGKRNLAFRFLNGYLELASDYSGLKVLRYYLAYRATVRSKIACIRLAQSPDGCSGSQLQQEFERYLKLAITYTQPQPRLIILTHGLSGSGKSTLAAPLAEKLGAILIRSDRERQRLFGQGTQNGKAVDIAGGVYSSEATAKTYARLSHLAQSVLSAGFPVIVDATFLTRSQREPFRALARRLSVPLRILSFDAHVDVLKRRIIARQRAGRDISEADLDVLQYQLNRGSDLDVDEKPDEVFIDTSRPRGSEEIMTLLQGSLRQKREQPLWVEAHG